MQTMQAIRIHQYGNAEQLCLDTIPRPTLRPHDVLVKVHAAAINPVDWKIREGYLAEMLGHTLPLTLGWDFSGDVVAVGEQVTQWQVGQAVYSRPDITRDGSYAEYIAVDADDIALKPQCLTWQQAAAVPLAALTAWQALYDTAKVKKGDRVLIQAGAGGVGCFAIQLAKLRGAYVYATTSTKNVDFVKDLGADTVIDYQKDDFSTLRDLDVVFDTLGGEHQSRAWITLKHGGYLVSIVDTPDTEIADSHQVRSAFCFVQPNSEQLTALTALFDADKLRVEIDHVFPFNQVAAAHEKSESHHARGKIILQITE